MTPAAASIERSSPMTLVLFYVGLVTASETAGWSFCEVSEKINIYLLALVTLLFSGQVKWLIYSDV